MREQYAYRMVRNIDQSTWLLILSNTLVILIAVVQKWDLETMMQIYWGQSVIIGIFYIIRMARLKNFSTAGMKINGRSIAPTLWTKIRVVCFFIIHYGGFLTAYSLFLFGIIYTNTGWSMNVDTDQMVYIAIAISIFFVNHLMSYLHNQTKDAPNQHIGTIMFMPYARILPIHLTLIVGAGVSGALILFLILKTVADVVMHVIEHKVLAKHATLPRA